MEVRKTIELLRATIDPNQRQQAEAQLDQIHKIIGFAPTLLQIVMMTDCDMPIRQAGAIYLKNLINNSWQEREVEGGQPLPFFIHEQDRALIRDSIVDAVVHAPDLIRTQLCTCVNTMVKHDFPGRWTQIVDKVSVYLSNPEPNGWLGAVCCMYQLVKIFEYKKSEERRPLHEAMNLLLPQLYQLITRILQDNSEQSVLLQKECLKVYFSIGQYILPLDIISKDTFTQWMEVCRQIIERPVPPQAFESEEDDRPDLPWWKCKKWALHIIYRMFERFGSPGHVSKEYNTFAEWYLTTFSNGILEVLLKQLDSYRTGTWLPPRCLQQTLNYLNQAVILAHTWKILKPHMAAILQDIVFPLLCYTAEDHERWTLDPHEYIRVKFDVFEDFVSPVNAAQTLLHTCCKKRKEVLPKTMIFLTQVLTDTTTEAALKDGALHMIGSLADILLKKKLYRDQLDQFFVKFVFPEFNSDRGHLRARACWIMHNFSEYDFKQDDILVEGVNLVIKSLLYDKDLPVKVEAAIALQSILTYQEKAYKHAEPRIKEISLELLAIIHETENEDVTGVMQKMVCIYTQHLIPIASDICAQLSRTFTQVVENDDSQDEKAIAAMGILNTIETLLTVLEDSPEILKVLEPTVLQIIVNVLQNEMHEYYEEVLALVYDLTSKHISEDMWKVFELMYQVFIKNGMDNFIDMMPVLHNYITVDKEAFLSDSKRLLAVYNMCKEVLDGNSYGEDPESHAAKLLEILLLQYLRQIDQAVPMLVQLAASRLLRQVKSSELRTMCLQVLIAALYYNPQLLFTVLEGIPDFTKHFIKQWLSDADCFLGIHDRKMCVIGICTLISLPNKPHALVEEAQKIVPCLIMIFEGLKRAYTAKALENGDDESDSSDEEDFEEVLSSDEDDIDDEGQDYLEALSKKAVSAGNNAGMPINSTINDINDDSDDDDSDYQVTDETVLESYTTPIDEENCDLDEFILFKDVMSRLETSEQEWYNKLLSSLSDQQKKALMEISILADQRRAFRESRKIEQQGGYVFTQQAVPTTFKFGDSSLG